MRIHFIKEKKTHRQQFELIYWEPTDTWVAYAQNGNDRVSIFFDNYYEMRRAIDDALPKEQEAYDYTEFWPTTSVLAKWVLIPLGSFTLIYGLYIFWGLVH